MAFKIHWRAPLQPKGFLKIIEFFLALITLSLVAGFSVTVSVTTECAFNSTNITHTLTLSYPLREGRETVMGNDSTTTVKNPIDDKGIPRAAEYFVAWGSLTLFYCVIAVLVYMLVTANERWEKALDFLVVTDIVFHVVWIFCWSIASVNWARAFNRLENILDDLLDVFPEGDCDLSMYRVLDRDTDSAIYVQAQIAVVFGFLIQFLWAVNIWWLIIDTSWYINWRSRRAEYSALD